MEVDGDCHGGKSEVPSGQRARGPPGLCSGTERVLVTGDGRQSKSQAHGPPPVSSDFVGLAFKHFVPPCCTVHKRRGWWCNHLRTPAALGRGRIVYLSVDPSGNSLGDGITMLSSA